VRQEGRANLRGVLLLIYFPQHLFHLRPLPQGQGACREIGAGPGGGLRFAASYRVEDGPVLELNGDELLDLDYAGLVSEHEESGAAATIVVAQVRSPFGVVDLREDGTVTGFREAPLLEEWVNSGVYVLGEEALDRLPEKGDHEQSTFPQLAAEGKLRGFRHTGVWLTVNTPKDLRSAESYMSEHPEWRPNRVV